MKRSLARHAALFLAYGALGSLLTAVTLLVVTLESRPDLAPWHLAELDAEYTASSGVKSLREYLALEQRLFEELEREVFAVTGPAAPYELNRYRRGSPSHPSRWPRDWNRTFELPADQPSAAVLLLHGLSDSPYSLRALGERLHAGGAHVLGLRIPGHGTAPAGLVDVRWRDMAAAVALAVEDLAGRFPGVPLHLVGYSNGATLALHTTLSALEELGRPVPDRLVLIAPQIGVTRLAALAVWQARLGHWLGLEKLAWNELLQEYDPFKYGSFAVNAGDISHRVTAAIQRQLKRLGASGRLQAVPPILAFSSVVDATVRAPDLVANLFNPLPPGPHQLVLFDINRRAAIEHLLKWRPDEWLAALQGASGADFQLTVVTNDNPHSGEVVALRYGADGAVASREPLGLSWPEGVYSLSHVALPFPESDPLYGGAPEPPSPGISLGNIAMHGERGVLQISDSAMLRQRWNPFYPYQEQRILAFLGLD